MRSNELRRDIRILLQNNTNREVYYHSASNRANFPYIVFALESSNMGSYVTYDMSIDIWDKTSDLTKIEYLADIIQDTFVDNVNLDHDRLLCCFKWNSRGYVEDSNKELKRLKLNVEFRYYK